MRTLAFFCLFLLLAGCPADAPPTPLDQQVYIWQRQWQPAHAQVLAQTRGDFSTLRVLALQAHPKAGWARAYADLRLLAEDRRPVIAVVRLDGQLPRLDQGEIIRQITDLLRDWQAAGIDLRGVEIDHDCATARLPAYAEMLQSLRPALPAGLPLSITALPTWLDSGRLDDLLRQVDGSVLQVHAVNDPRDGLFDPQQALRWAERYAERSERPFLLALPAYGVALIDSSTLVESEAPLNASGTRRELMADPQQVADLLAALRGRHPPNLSGIIWFRLPLPGDRRAWPLSTLQAVIHGEPLQAALDVEASQPGPLHELALFNPGNRDAELPRRITLAHSDCEAADALPGYRLERTPTGPAFIRKEPARLAAGQRHALGWARCTTFDQGAIHVSP
ncbi:DUF3142 domain-containing protein [Pseudomonas sp. LRF_L74]|uniref:DUF3142 domain-containing protein n=1 Tax=Pseudomonas sp. LRF_L74 TaxID=3369422 RepID=UPI003F644F33